ncbi:MAG: glycosyltransferase, partial [Gemmataceae bacterium]
MKVLYYNWVDFEDEQQRGGGVSIYQRNLIDAAAHCGDEVWFLSSGFCYSPFSRRPFLREVKARNHGVRKFEIVNSTIISPGQLAFGQDVAASPELEPLFADFLRQHGPFDVVHFNNLEGIPLSFLRLAREHHPFAKIIYSVHNYFAFCPQVNLWFQERAACRDFRDGRKCVNCLIRPLYPRRTRWLYRLDYCLRKLGIPWQSVVDRALPMWLIFRLLRSAYHLARGIFRGKTFATKVPQPSCATRRATKAVAILDPSEAARFADRRRLFVDALNSYADHVLAVSRRVAELTVGFGIDAAKVRTLYIGTRFAEDLRVSEPRPSGSGGAPRSRTIAAKRCDVLHIAYLGYMRRDKGFYFYLKALKEMPSVLARRLALTFAAKIVNPKALVRIKRMAHRFASVTFHDGYTHGQLPDILRGIDLAVVPVLWEDNLPQVAIE